MSEADKENLSLFKEESWTLWRTIMPCILYADDLYDIVTGRKELQMILMLNNSLNFERKRKRL